MGGCALSLFLPLRGGMNLPGVLFSLHTNDVCQYTIRIENEIGVLCGEPTPGPIDGLLLDQRLEVKGGIVLICLRARVGQETILVELLSSLCSESKQVCD